MKPSHSLGSQPSQEANFTLRHLSVVAFFLTLTLLWLRPLSFNLFTQLPGQDDLWLQFWNQWWMGKALFDLGQSPMFTDFAYYPLGVNLYFHALSPMNSLVAAMMKGMVGPIAAFNILFIATFVLSGYGAYLAAYEISKSNISGLVAGYIFAFSPYHFLHVRQLEHMTIQWIAFLFFALIRLMNKKDSISPLAAALFFAFSFYSNAYYGLSCGVLVGLIFVYDLFLIWRQKKFNDLKPWVIFGVGACILILPYLLGMVAAGRSVDKFKVELWVKIYQSIDLLALVTPSFNNSLLSSWFPTMWLYQTFTGTETVGYLGLSVIVLCVIGFTKGVCERKFILAATAIVFVTLSLGPVLHFAGIVTIPGGYRIPLPQLLLQATPIISSARVPARYLAIGMLPIAILAGVGAQILWHRKATSKIICLVLLSMVIVEYWNRPLETSTPEVRPYSQFLAATPGDFVLLYLPLHISHDRTKWWKSADPYTQGWDNVIHGKKSMTGPISHTALNRKHFEYFLKSDLLAPLVTAETDIVHPLPKRIALRRMEELGLKYIVLDLEKYGGRRESYFYKRDRAFLTNKWGLKVVYEGDDATVIETF